MKPDLKKYLDESSETKPGGPFGEDYWVVEWRDGEADDGGYDIGDSDDIANYGPEIVRHAPLRLLNWDMVATICPQCFANRLAPADAAAVCENWPNCPDNERVLNAIKCAAGTAWPISDVLTQLADAVDHLLNEHNCDMHGYEEIAHARDAARRIVSEIQAGTGKPSDLEVTVRLLREAVVFFKRNETEICRAFGDPEPDAEPMLFDKPLDYRVKLLVNENSRLREELAKAQLEKDDFKDKILRRIR